MGWVDELVRESEGACSGRTFFRPCLHVASVRLLTPGLPHAPPCLASACILNQRAAHGKLAFTVSARVAVDSRGCRPYLAGVTSVRQEVAICRGVDLCSSGVLLGPGRARG